MSIFFVGGELTDNISEVSLLLPLICGSLPGDLHSFDSYQSTKWHFANFRFRTNT